MKDLFFFTFSDGIHGFLSGEFLIGLLNLSIQASFLILAVLLLRLLLQKAPSGFRLGLWALVALRLLLPVSIRSIFSLIPSAETIPADIIYAEKPGIESGLPYLNQTVNPAIQGSLAPSAEASANPLQIVFFILSVLWLAGILAFLLYFLISQIRLGKRLSTAVKCDGNVRESDRINTPLVFGILRPAIYLPFSIRKEFRPAIIAHEKAHIRHLDHFWKLLSCIILALYWFNPLVWLSWFLFQKDLELSCDERTIRYMNAAERADYSEALLSCSTDRRRLLLSPIAFGETAVKSRIRAALNYKKPAFWIILAAAAALLVTAVCFLTVPQGDGASVRKQLSYQDFDADSLNDYYQNQNAAAVTKEFRLRAFRGTVFQADIGEVRMKKGGKTTVIANGFPLVNVYTADLNQDGAPEICSTSCFGSGMINSYVDILDLKDKVRYRFWDRGTTDYDLYEEAGTLMLRKSAYPGGFPGSEIDESHIRERVPLSLSDPDIQLGGGALVSEDPNTSLYGIYQYEEAEITLTATGFALSFGFPGASLCYGTRSIFEDHLVMLSEDGKYRFTFDIVNGSLKYLEKDSSEWPLAADGSHAPGNGDVFVKVPDSETDASGVPAELRGVWYYGTAKLELSENGFVFRPDDSSSSKSAEGTPLFQVSSQTLTLPADNAVLTFQRSGYDLVYLSGSIPLTWRGLKANVRF